MNYNYKLLIEYDGTLYDGWQRQGNTKRTIQGKLEESLSDLYGREIEIIGSGRTDAGVHAKGQVANFYMSEKIELWQLKRDLNERLNMDIRILAAEQAGEQFHSRFHAKTKVYKYEIDQSQKAHVFTRKYKYHVEKLLEVESMRKAAQQIIGTHDFTSFTSDKNEKKSKIRRVDSIEIVEQGSMITLVFTGNGFLYHMVRILSGTFIEIGSGMREEKDMRKILQARDRSAAGFTAPSQGLYLERVIY
jgi:tRNA pseudouridine38-40 synthase